MWPVLERELHSTSRKQTTYVLRIVGGFLVLSVIASFTLFQPGPHRGGELFDRLYRYLFLAVWIVVPFAAADCISGERREGTLPLLLLTPIRSWHIVLAKSLSQVLRLLGFAVAALPALAVPFLLGGVKWWEATFALLILASSFCWAFAASLLVSSRSTVWWRATVGSALASLLAMIFFATLFAIAIFPLFSPPGGLFAFAENSIRRFIILALWLTLTIFEAFGQNSPWMKVTSGSILPAGLVLLGISFSALLLSLILAGWRLGSRASATVASAPGPVEIAFCQPVFFPKLYRAWARRRLDANPIGWLEQRTWSARVTRWCTFGFLLIAYTGILADGFRARTLIDAQLTIAFSVLLAMAYASAASFHRERQNGVLPLLLTAPLSISDVIGGRLRSIWGQFLLASGLVMLMWFGLNSITRRPWEFHHWLWFFGISFFTVPVVGLLYSLRQTRFINAFGWTLLMGVVLPLAIGAVPLMLLNNLTGSDDSSILFGLVAWLQTIPFTQRDSFWAFPACIGGVAQIAIGTIAFKRLYVCMAERTFALHQ